MVIELERTEDILASLGKMKRAGQKLIGFAAETDDMEDNALGKLKRKNLDWIAANRLICRGRGLRVIQIRLFFILPPERKSKYRWHQKPMSQNVF